MKETIKLNKVIINNDQVTITSDHTGYVNEFRVPRINIKHLLKRFISLTKLLKENGTVVSHKYKTRKFIADNIEQYNNEYLTYNQNFESVVTIAKIITSKPLYVGTSDNAELNQMYTHRNKCISMLSRSSIITKVLEFESKINNLLQELEDQDCNYSKVVF